MQMVRIRFPDHKSRTLGFYELMRRVRVVCLAGDEFLVPHGVLRKRGQIVLDQIRTVDKARLVRKVGKLDSETQAEVLDGLSRRFAPGQSVDKAIGGEK